jgi:hypothetical protein
VVCDVDVLERCEMNLADVRQLAPWFEEQGPGASV